MKLNKPQTRALDFLEDRTTNEVLFGGSAGPGKSTLLCYWQLKQRIKYAGTCGLIGRTSLKTLKETTLLTFYNVAKMQGFEKSYKLYGNSELRFRNGSTIFLKDLFYYPADPDVDEMGSLELTDAGIDEASQVNSKVREVLNSRIRYKLDENDLIPKALYVTNPGKNWTKHDFYTPHNNGTLPDDRKFVAAFLKDNKDISKHYEGNLRKLSKPLRDRLLSGNWNYADDPTQLMTSENIKNIFTNAHVRPEGNKYITADIARKGKDRIIIRAWHGWRVLSRTEINKAAITTTAERIRALANQFGIPSSRILCDEDGIGGGVVDILNCKGFVANAKPSDSYKNKNNKNFATNKDQCGWWLAEKVNSGQVYEELNDTTARDSIIEELEWIKDAGLNKDGKNKLVSKDTISENIGRSPDDSDTYLMRSWFDLHSGSGIEFFN